MPVAERSLRTSPTTALVVVGFGIFVAADDLTVVTTMLRPIIGDLGIVLPDGLDDAAWIVNAYLVAYVAVMPFTGRLSDLLGRRRVYLGALGIFLAGSIIIPMTDSLGPFLVGRVMTAVGGGALVPVGMAVVGDAFAEAKRARALGTLGAIDTLGWVWGPLFGAFLVRFLSWEWQFYLNVPLALVGMAAAWWVLSDAGAESVQSRIDWTGAAYLTGSLVALNLALLGSAEVQSVTGLDELTGSSGEELRWLYIPAVVLGVMFVMHQRRAPDPLIDPGLFRGRNLSAAVAVNFFVGAALVIAMVDVPIFVNQIEGGIERAAVASGWVLSALTATMALASYVGGRFTERTWYRPPVLVGLGAAAAAFLLTGATWDVDTALPTMAWQLAILGAGFGLVIAPTSSAVIDGAPPDRRGAAASLVMVLRLLGLSVGLSALTAWGLFRFNQLRDDVVLPPLDDPGYADAVQAAQAELTTSALAETFIAAAVVVAVAAAVALMMRREVSGTGHAAPATDEIDGAQGEPPDPRQDQRKEPMNEYVRRHIGWIVGGLAVLLVVALATAAFAVQTNQSLSDDLDEARADVEVLRGEVEQLRGGTALFAAQVTAFQDQLSRLAPSVAAGIGDAISGLDAFATSTLRFEVPIDEEIPIDATIDLNRTITVPIQTTIPIDETVETTITVAGPFGIDIPLNVTVPVQLDLPIDLDVAFSIDEQIPVSTNVPVNLRLPIAIEIADTEMATLVASLRSGLEAMEEILGGLAVD